MTTFFRFPHTPHLTWLGDTPPRNDKVLTPQERRDLLASEVFVEEKIDGANLGFSVDEDGNVHVQNRGTYLALNGEPGQFRPLRRWLQPRLDSLAEALIPDLMLFGEWCYAVHSIRYTRLPDWFIAFDVYDKRHGKFWSVSRRDALLKKLQMAVVPRIAKGKFDTRGILDLLGRSTLAEGPAEGLYVRRDDGEYLGARAKVVRREFAQAIDAHWSKRALQTNALADDRTDKHSWR